MSTHKLENQPMITDQSNQSAAAFHQTVSVALAQLKQRLQRNYERGYPDLRGIIHLVLEEEEARAWELTSFPHLLLPDLVEAHLASLNLHTTKRQLANVFAAQDFNFFEAYVPAH
jgi:hypothetical protein